MDISQKPVSRTRSHQAGTRGIALAATIAALTAVTILMAAVWIIADLSGKASRNRQQAVQALQLAEAAMAHGLALLRGPFQDTSFTRILLGPDNAPSTPDDGLMIGYGLAPADEIPTQGVSFAGGTYFLTMIDDPADTDADPLRDANNRIVARCRGATANGASATVSAVIGIDPLPGIVSDGNLTINGNPDILGACGSVHANQIVVVSGNPTVSGTVSASDTVEVSGSIRDPNGQPINPLSHQPPIEVPRMDPMDYCGDADYILLDDGTLTSVAPPTQTYDATSSDVFGWKMASSSPVLWDVSGNSMAGGTYCVEGNVKISGNPQGPGNSSLPLTILSTGSVEFSGNPQVTPAHPDGLMIISGGDVKISGNPAAGEDNYGGVIYARAQCMLNGNPTIGGQVMCDDDPEAPGAENWVDENAISGNPTIRYECGGTFGGMRRVLAWYQVLGD